MSAIVQANITLLANELKNDPLSLGYAALIQQGNDNGLVALLNSQTGPGANTLPHDPITGATLLGAIDPNELVANLTALQGTALKFFTDVQQQSLPISGTKFQTWLTGMFTQLASPNTHAAILALQSQVASRAQFLYSNSATVVDTSDVDAAKAAAGLSVQTP